ncbi:MAG: HEAT repeat domain-containing protein [Gemmatimonadota bacterium]|nr:HEAT repeat domain-containing protein [Gemmatimonadota bacterium]
MPDFQLPTAQLLHALAHQRTGGISPILEELHGRHDLPDAARAVLSTGSTDEKAMALVALRGVAGKSMVEVARHALRDESPRIRGLALTALVGSPDDAHDTLLAALQDPDPEIKARAVEALAHTEAAQDALRNMVSSQDERHRLVGVKTVSRLSLRALDLDVRASVRDTSAEVRAAAIAALSDMGEATREELIAVLRDPDEHVRLNALEALAREPGELSPVFVDLLSDPAAGVRLLALRIFGKSGKGRHCNDVLPLVVDPIGNVRGEAIRTLGSLACHDASGTLRGLATESEDEGDRVDALRALNDLGAAYIDPVLPAALRDRSAHVRSAAAEVARVNAAREIFLSLCDLVISDPSATVRAAAARSLAGSQDVAVIPLSRALTLDPRQDVRIAAAHALTSFEHAAVRPLVQALDDPNPNVRQVAVRGLGSINASDAVPQLMCLNEREESEEVRAELLSSLARLDRRARAALASSGTRKPLFDPADESRPYTTWLRDPAGYPTSAGVVFYNTGRLKVLDDEGTGRSILEYDVEGGLLRLYATGNLVLTTAFSIAREEAPEEYGRTGEHYRLAVTDSGPLADAGAGPSQFFHIKY